MRFGDGSGLPVATAPFHLITSNPVWDRFAYDALSRQTRIRHSDGTYRRTTYTVREQGDRIEIVLSA